MSDLEPSEFHFRQEIYAIFREALSRDLSCIEVSAQELHDRVAKKSASSQEALASSCDVIRSVFNSLGGDRLIEDANIGCQPRLTIQYVIPRPEWGTWR